MQVKKVRPYEPEAGDIGIEDDYAMDLIDKRHGFTSIVNPLGSLDVHGSRINNFLHRSINHVLKARDSAPTQADKRGAQTLVDDTMSALYNMKDFRPFLAVIHNQVSLMYTFGWGEGQLKT